MFDNKTLLITGSTGSFGVRCYHTLLDSNLKEIRNFSRDEKKQEDMRIKFRNPKMNFSSEMLEISKVLIIPMVGVDFVFHAAALNKFRREFFPLQAVAQMF